MLIDDITIAVKSGNGGDGRVDFNRTKMSLGPTGGKGGKGGSAYLRAVSDIGALSKFRHKRNFSAQNGAMGGIQICEGKSGEDLTLTVPVGTVVVFGNGRETQEMTRVGQKLLVAKGGIGGRGNFLFRSPTNTSPKQREEGKPGEEVELHLTLKLIADVGFVGLPNAGKSSLLNSLTNAKSRVANYAFTTLEPHLGAYYELILADIPGLIEGASEGRGLGVKFLRHVERTNTLFHLVSVENEDVVDAYTTVREELGKYNPELLAKKEHVFLSKCDLVSFEEMTRKKELFANAGISAIVLSSETGEGLDVVKKILAGVEKEKLANRDDVSTAPLE